jgi:hypothetical protein
MEVVYCAACGFNHSFIPNWDNDQPDTNPYMWAPCPAEFLRTSFDSPDCLISKLIAEGAFILPPSEDQRERLSHFTRLQKLPVALTFAQWLVARAKNEFARSRREKRSSYRRQFEVLQDEDVQTGEFGVPSTVQATS